MVLVQDALQAGGTATVQNIVAAAVTADLTKPVTNSVTIAGAAIQAFGSPTATNFLNVAQGAVSAARLTDAGSIAYTLISDSPGFSRTTSLPQMFKTWSTGALTAAYTTGKQGALASIVYNSENAAYNTTATLTTSVTQAINSMQALGSVESRICPRISPPPQRWLGAAELSQPTTRILTAIVNAAMSQDSRPVRRECLQRGRSHCEFHSGDQCAWRTFYKYPEHFQHNHGS